MSARLPVSAALNTKVEGCGKILSQSDALPVGGSSSPPRKYQSTSSTSLASGSLTTRTIVSDNHCLQSAAATYAPTFLAEFSGADYNVAHHNLGTNLTALYSETGANSDFS